MANLALQHQRPQSPIFQAGQIGPICRTPKVDFFMRFDKKWFEYNCHIEGIERPKWLPSDGKFKMVPTDWHYESSMPRRYVYKADGQEGFDIVLAEGFEQELAMPDPQDGMTFKLTIRLAEKDIVSLDGKRKTKYRYEIGPRPHRPIHTDNFYKHK